MKQLTRMGGALFDYMAISFILLLSFALVIPFLPVVIGVHAYAVASKEERSLMLLFTTVFRTRLKVWLFGIAMTLILIVAGLNIAAFPFQDLPGSIVITIISWIIAFLSVNTFLYAAVLLLHMDLHFGQLVYNALVLAIGSPLDWIASMLSIGILIGMALWNPIVVLPAFAAAWLFSSRFTHHAWTHATRNDNDNPGGNSE
jgi:uncharacterized membrane protein YesL